jgi:hypothetical protein
MSRNIIVNLFSGNAVEGVCTYDGRNFIILRTAVVHTPGTEATPPADGEVRIDRSNIDFVQML